MSFVNTECFRGRSASICTADNPIKSSKNCSAVQWLRRGWGAAAHWQGGGSACVGSWAPRRGPQAKDHDQECVDLKADPAPALVMPQFSSGKETQGIRARRKEEHLS